MCAEDVQNAVPEVGRADFIFLGKALDKMADEKGNILPPFA